MAFDNIKLEKGLYTTGKSFSGALEALDPSENYIGTELEGLDAYQRQLKRFDIKISGKDSDCIAKFFQTSDSATLFPEYISRAVRQGMERDNLLDKIIATTTVVDSLDYRAVGIDPEEKSLFPATIGEGAFIPETHIKLKDSLTSLKKHGRMLVASYEAIKFQKLDLFTLVLEQIGQTIAAAQTGDAISTIYACEEVAHFDKVSVNNKLSYVDMLILWEEMTRSPLTTIVCNKSIMRDILNITEFRDAAAGLNFHATGKMITPFGAELVTLNRMDLNNTVVGINKNYALEMVQAGGIVTDFDKLIDRQLERAAITATAGFSLIDSGAAIILNTSRT